MTCIQFKSGFYLCVNFKYIYIYISILYIVELSARCALTARRSRLSPWETKAGFLSKQPVVQPLKLRTSSCLVYSVKQILMTHLAWFWVSRSIWPWTGHKCLISIHLHEKKSFKMQIKWRSYVRRMQFVSRFFPMYVKNSLNMYFSFKRVRYPNWSIFH